jgi:signal transduction histidine kinase
VASATRELRVANYQLKKLDEAKSEFISIASHQLRTPLTVIKGYSSMMIEGSFGVVPDPIMSNIKKIYESNQRLITLVEDLLNISRIESGRLQFNFEVCQLEEMVGSVVEELKVNADNKNLFLVYDRPVDTLAAVKVDKSKLRQVLINLIDNGIKYTSVGGLTVKVVQDGRLLRFTVTDTGIGIAAEDMPYLFKKFSRGEGISVVHTEGTGLGLYVGKMMIEEQHGHIWVQSAGNGKGSVFGFELPIAEDVPDVVVEAEPAK